MKKLFFVLFFASFSLIGKSQTTNPDPTQGGAIKGSYIYVDWGRKSKDCEQGFGICKFQMSLTPADLLITVAAIMGGQIGSIPIQVIMDRRYYESNAKQFPNSSIQLDEDYLLTLDVAKSLGLPEGSRLKAGTYKLVYDDRAQSYSCSVITNIK
jgi:hypothetical protein